MGLVEKEDIVKFQKFEPCWKVGYCGGKTKGAIGVRPARAFLFGRTRARSTYALVVLARLPRELVVARRDGRIQPGHLVLLQGVGGGFTWGSVLVRM